MRIELDGREMTDRKRTHDYLASKLQLPDYYGRNLDALYDMLTDRKGELEICLHHAAEMNAQLGTYGSKLFQTMLDAARENPLLLVTLCAALDESEDPNFFEKSKNNT